MNKFLSIAIAFLMAVFVIVAVVILLISQSNKAQENSAAMPVPTATIAPRSSFELPIQSRDYKIGIAGFFPVNFPNSTTTQNREYLQTVNEIGEIVGIHTNYDKLNIVDLYASQTTSEINLVLGLEKPTGSASASEVIEKITLYLKKYPQIKYLALGNEINFNFVPNSSKYLEFLAKYKALYTQLKGQFPELKIYTTFQYETLIGKGYLTGKKGQPVLSMLSDFKDYIDVIGLTVYPYFDYKNPEEI